MMMMRIKAWPKCSGLQTHSSPSRTTKNGKTSVESARNQDRCGIQKRGCVTAGTSEVFVLKTASRVSVMEDPEIPTLKKTEMKVWMAKVRASR
mmetsp:Transcript_34826/g.62696  ORF Transcript_34826/g.62696 Transcript_34826/m.62696 type:complete len:93 (-) Transcript_34826:126-404(-)